MAVFVGVVIIIVTNLTLSGPGSSAASFPKSPVQYLAGPMPPPLAPSGLAAKLTGHWKAAAFGSPGACRRRLAMEDLHNGRFSVRALLEEACADFFRMKPNNLPRTKGGA